MPIIPCLWFDTQAEEAATLYTSLIRNSRIISTSRFREEGSDLHGKEPGSVMTVEFEIDGSRFVALNGGPSFTFTPATSFQIMCESQDEVDRYWNALTEGGEPSQCGWLRDRFGVSWQIIPTALPRLLQDPDRERSGRVMQAMLGMQKIEIAELERAAEGG